jgi:hypothetical protein
MGYATDCRMADWRYFAGARRELARGVRRPPVARQIVDGLNLKPPSPGRVRFHVNADAR